MLINKSASLEYDDEGFLVKEPQKKYGEGLFTKEEFQKIKKILGVSVIEKIPFQKGGYKLNRENNTNHNKDNKLTGIIITIILLACMVFAGILLYFSKRKTR